jgi:hypothetical protein
MELALANGYVVDKRVIAGKLHHKISEALTPVCVLHIADLQKIHRRYGHHNCTIANCDPKSLQRDGALLLAWSFIVGTGKLNPILHIQADEPRTQSLGLGQPYACSRRSFFLPRNLKNERIHLPVGNDTLYLRCTVENLA